MWKRHVRVVHAWLIFRCIVCVHASWLVLIKQAGVLILICLTTTELCVTAPLTRAPLHTVLRGD